MARVERISDPGDPRVDLYRGQRDAWLRASHRPGASAGATGTGYDGGLFMAEGELVVRALLGSRFVPESVFGTEARLEAMGDALASAPPDLPVLVASREVMAGVCGFDVHRGVLAAARRGPEPRADELAARSRVLVVLEDLANHDNVGSIFRSVAALGGARAGGGAGGGVGVLLSPRCCDPLYRKALRVSMGQALRVPFARIEPWPGGLGALAGFTTVALCTDADARPIGEVPRPDKVALLIGGEGPGLSAAARSAAAVRARIPMAPGVDSLNAGVAAAIALYALA